MITIDQLLESVDLDFEPRFVTKDDEGDIRIWDYKPDRNKYSWLIDRVSRVVDYPYLKLADFENKPWQECIYEVPRKTTGKIERLLSQKLTIGETKYEYPTHEMLVDKINELVDAVNELKGAKNETKI